MTWSVVYGCYKENFVHSSAGRCRLVMIYRGWLLADAVITSNVLIDLLVLTNAECCLMLDGLH